MYSSRAACMHACARHHAHNDYLRSTCAGQALLTVANGQGTHMNTSTIPQRTHEAYHQWLSQARHVTHYIHAGQALLTVKLDKMYIHTLIQSITVAHTRYKIPGHTIHYFPRKKQTYFSRTVNTIIARPPFKKGLPCYPGGVAGPKGGHA